MKLYGESCFNRKTLIEVRLLGKVHSAQIDVFDSNLIITDDFRKIYILIDDAWKRESTINCCLTFERESIVKVVQEADRLVVYLQTYTM